MRLHQKELLLYNDSFDNWEIIKAIPNSQNTVLSFSTTLHSSPIDSLFCVGTANGEVLLSKNGQDYLLKQPKISDTNTTFTSNILKIIRAGDTYTSCYLILTTNNELYFSGDNLETVEKQRALGGVYLDMAYFSDKFWVVGENGFYVRASIIRRAGASGYKYSLSWESPTGFTSKNIQQIKFLNNTEDLIAIDYEYKNNLYYNYMYKYSYSSGWEVFRASIRDYNMVDVTSSASKMLSILSDSRLSIYNATENMPLIFDIQINGSGITYCNGYYIACGTNGKIVVSDDLENWKEFTIQDSQGVNLSLKYISSNEATGDIVAMDSNYLVYINTKLLDKLMEL